MEIDILFEGEAGELCRREAKKMCELAQKQWQGRNAEPWVKYLYFELGRKDTPHAGLDGYENEVQNSFYLFVRQDKDLKDDVVLKRASLLSGPEKLDAVVELLKRFFYRFRMFLKDKWRDLPGTFHNLYHKMQMIISKCAETGWAGQGWSMYDKGQYYGRSGLDEEHAKHLDLKDFSRLANVPLPTPAPAIKDVLSSKFLCPASMYFHGELCQLEQCDSHVTVVSVRNVVAWLCRNYPLQNPDYLRLDAVQSLEDAQGEDAKSLPLRARDSVLPPASLLDEQGSEAQAMMYAEQIAIKLEPEERVLYALKVVDEKNLEACAVDLGLSGPSAVKYRWDMVCAKLRKEMTKYEELSPADDDADGERILQYFLPALGKVCARERRA